MGTFFAAVTTPAKPVDLGDQPVSEDEVPSIAFKLSAKLMSVSVKLYKSSGPLVSIPKAI